MPLQPSIIVFHRIPQLVIISVSLQVDQTECRPSCSRNIVSKGSSPEKSPILFSNNCRCASYAQHQLINPLLVPTPCKDSGVPAAMTRRTHASAFPTMEFCLFD